MEKLLKTVLLAGSISLMSPVIADEYADDYDDGDYAAAPVVYNNPQTKRQAPAAKPRPVAAKKKHANKLASVTPKAKKSKPSHWHYVEPFE